MERPGAGSVASRLADVRRRITEAGGDADRIRIVAVTKGFGPAAVSEAVAAGLSDLGENYAQELLDKAADAPPGARWHFLGRLQRNKIPKLAPAVWWWHTVDRVAAAEAVAAARPGAGVLVQVNLSGQAERPGCAPGDAAGLVGTARALGLDARGLMGVAPAGGADHARPGFRWLAAEARRLGLAELSMGMSDDFEAAVSEGSTTLRLGRILFGPRPGRGAAQR